jgi:DNA-binding NarL/FixJ family response regulator
MLWESEDGGIAVNSAAVGTKPRVFIAEDSVLISLDLERILSDYGCEIAGQAAFIANSLEIISASQIDFALIDYRLGDGTSEPVTEALKNKAIPYALCTGQSKNDFPTTSLDVPVIWKPFVPEDIHRVIDHLVGKS